MKKLNRKARQYLLTGKPEAYAFGFRYGPEGRFYSGGRWGLHLSPLSNPLLFFFPDPGSRAFWISLDPRNRAAVGVRHPLVKAFRRRAAGGVR